MADDATGLKKFRECCFQPCLLGRWSIAIIAELVAGTPQSFPLGAFMTLQHRFVIVSLAIVGLSTAANAQKIVSAVGGTINSGGPGSGALALS